MIHTSSGDGEIFAFLAGGGDKDSASKARGALVPRVDFGGVVVELISGGFLLDALVEYVPADSDSRCPAPMVS